MHWGILSLAVVLECICRCWLWAMRWACAVSFAGVCGSRCYSLSGVGACCALCVNRPARQSMYIGVRHSAAAMHSCSVPLIYAQLQYTIVILPAM